jgi:transcription initiation factor TFIID subunit 2
MTDRSSCRQFNGPGDISDLANKTEAVYRREWPKAIDPRMTPEEKRAMNSLLVRAIKEPTSHIFREPVDPVKLNIPGYFDVYVWYLLSLCKGWQVRIPVEDARDLSTIKTNLEKGRYTTYKQVDDDFTLMLDNARVFNGEGEITDIVDKFGRWWDAQRKKMD